jgi:hypothetical protein
MVAVAHTRAALSPTDAKVNDIADLVEKCFETEAPVHFKSVLIRLVVLPSLRGSHCASPGMALGV